MKNPTRTIVIELSHAINTSPIGQFTDEQLALLRSLPQVRQDQIRKGVPVAVIDLESGKTMAVFNKENISTSQTQRNLLAMTLLDAAREFYQDPENVKAFEDSQRNRETHR